MCRRIIVGRKPMGGKRRQRHRYVVLIKGIDSDGNLRFEERNSGALDPELAREHKSRLRYKLELFLVLTSLST